MNATETINWQQRFDEWWEELLSTNQCLTTDCLYRKLAKVAWDARGLAEAKIAAAEAQFDTPHAFNASLPKMVADMNRIPYGSHHVTMPDTNCSMCGAPLDAAGDCSKGCAWR